MARPADPLLRQNILKAARQVFGEKGFAKARMSDIAERAGVAVGTIYLHFETKEALCTVFADLINQRIIDEALPLLLESDPAQAIAESVRAILRILNEERDLLALLYLGIGFDSLLDYEPTELDRQIWQTLARMLQARMDAGEFQRYDADKLAHILSGLIERTVVGCLILDAGQIPEYEATLVAFIQRALLAQPSA